MYEKIMVPIDSITFDNTLHAVEDAIEFETGCGLPKVIFLHVWNTVKSGISGEVEQRMRDVRESQINQEFTEIKEMCKEAGLDDCETIFKEGGAAHDEIVKMATEKDVDLIVMGSGKLHDQSVSGKIRKFAYGSVTENVIHESPCSILVSTPPTSR